MPRIGGDTGVIVVSSHDHMAMFEACARQSAGFVTAVKRLSEYSRARSAGSGTGINQFMSGVSTCIETSGAFCGVQAGYLDFSGQSLEAAAERLVQAGAGSIIAAGLPLLMHHHALSWSDPSEALKQLKKTCTANLIYIPPDPGTMAKAVGMMLLLKVLDALAKGDIIEPSGLRDPIFSF
jgi:phosphoribosylpyrophosphate synthetase